MRLALKVVRGEVLAAVVTLLALLLWEAGRWDLPLSHLYGGPHGFALRDAWWTRGLLHEGGRWLAACALALQAWDAARPIVPGPTRAQRAYWLLVTAASMLLVPLLKHFSATSCPWDLAEFGGGAVYVPHWLPGVADMGPGRCFPSGHAVSGFAFFGLYFLWRPYRPCAAWIVLAATLAAGAAAGWVQVVRGAHFPSHALWSGWLCWSLAMVAQAAWSGEEAVRRRGLRGSCARARC
ncbi:phosphatase PAP2 family protein [Methylibium rhizosphaerae]|uniref:phosphatase PAP2 family protein n=1 Tax=Methylibium rhizosphaerae TaxID=2570323 RepID=UPI00112EE452|nr:phosphatase PAP2 family protein [Methylibium rhizosphaerae]